MVIDKLPSFTICACCLRGQRCTLGRRYGALFSLPGALPLQARQSRYLAGSTNVTNVTDQADHEEKDRRMTETLSQMTDDHIQQGGRGVKKAIEEAGFAEDLRAQLEARIEDSRFKTENATAYSQINMPSSAGKTTRETAAAQPWGGTETLEDAALRMLNDAHKPLRNSSHSRSTQARMPSISVDMRMKQAVKKSQVERLANARDRMSVYSLSQDPSLTEKEREVMRKNLKERFKTGARPMPASVQGLAALANERIEDAIARGQFKDIARGKGTNVERDHNANSPFLDTTEYFMNKMIQKQEIVPPWIEKQQELVKSAARFRGRLRNDWKRHAARSIASIGGSVQDQVRRAEAYALAEQMANPRIVKQEVLNEIGTQGAVAQVVVTEKPVPSIHAAQDSMITVSAETAPNLARYEQSSHGKTPQQCLMDVSPRPHHPSRPLNEGSSEYASSERPSEGFRETSETLPLAHLPPFRDEAWLSLERPYHEVAIRDLNNLTRSYNLQAPDLAKKPYFSLDRELRSCFADIAPQLPNEIVERAKRPEKIRVEVVGHRAGSLLEKFSQDKVKVYDSTKPNYGFKQFWRELWGSQAT